jgi:hypothetical protein
VLVREPQHAPSPDRQLGVTLAVGAEHGGRAVEPVAVDLDDEALLRPREVAQDAFDERVRVRPRDAVVVAELEERLLEWLRVWGVV